MKRHPLFLAVILTCVCFFGMGQMRRVIRGSAWFEATVSRCTNAAQVRSVLELPAVDGTNLLVTGLLTGHRAHFTNEVTSLSYFSGSYFKTPGWYLVQDGNGVARFVNANGGAMDRIQIGGWDSNSPALKQNGTAVEFRLADDTDHAPITASVIRGVKGYRQAHGSLTHAGTTTCDFNATNTAFSMSATGNVTVAFANVADERNYRLLIKNGQATNISVTWPSGIHGYTSTVVSNATWLLASMEAWGTGDTNVWVSTSNDGTYTP